MPAWLQTLNYGSVLKYAGNVLATSELRGLTLSCGGGAGGACALPDGAAVLSLYRFHPADFDKHLWAMGLCVLLYRLAACAILGAFKDRHL